MLIPKIRWKNWKANAIKAEKTAINKNQKLFFRLKNIEPKNKANEAAKNMEKVSRSYNFPASDKPALPEDNAEASQTETIAPQLMSKADLGILTLPFLSAAKIQKSAVNKMPPKKNGFAGSERRNGQRKRENRHQKNKRAEKE